MSAPASALRHVNVETQDRLAKVTGYHRWIYDTIAPYLGRRILDVGCASGNITKFMLGRDLIIGIDPLEEFVQAVRERFAGSPEFRAERMGIEDPAVEGLAADRLDTITCLNVLEHVEDDRAALARMFRLLAPGGRLVLQLPAHQWLYGTLDAADLHFRRYTRPDARAKVAAAGFAIDACFWMNPLGILGWYLNGKILKKKIFPEDQGLLFNVLVPILRGIEAVVKPPIGLSLILVGRRPAAGGGA